MNYVLQGFAEEMMKSAGIKDFFKKGLNKIKQEIRKKQLSNFIKKSPKLSPAAEQLSNIKGKVINKKEYIHPKTGKRIIETEEEIDIPEELMKQLKWDQ